MASKNDRGSQNTAASGINGNANTTETLTAASINDGMRATTAVADDVVSDVARGNGGDGTLYGGAAVGAVITAPEAAQEESYAGHEYIVRARGVTRTYEIGGNPVHALRGIDIDIRRGEYISIMGPSGSGKSTLFNMIGGLDKPTSGTVFIDEVDMAQLDAFELAWLRCRKIGYIFQTFNLIPVMTALENITLPMIFAGADTDQQLEKGRKLLEAVGIAHRMHNKPSQLSGGQQQRVAIARALANDPAIILADEPTGNLDQKTGKEIIELLKRLNKESGVTIITATHDDKMLAASDRVVVVSDGRVTKLMTPGEMNLAEGTVSGFAH